MRVILTRALRNACFLAMLLTCNWLGIAKAESLVYTDTVPITSVSTYPKSFTFPQFNPTLGILTNVTITVTGEFTGSAGYENLDVNPAAVNAQVIANLQVNTPNNSSLNIGGSMLTINDTPPAFDGTIDFSGSSGKTYSFAQTVTMVGNYGAADNLTPYVGNGLLNSPITASSAWSGSGSAADLLTSVKTRAGATAQIRYVYAIPQIVLKKFTNGFDADHPNDADVPQVHPGDPITWTYLLTNTGSITIPLADIVATDSQLGVTPVRVPASDANSDSLLSPGEVWLYRATGVAQNLAAPTGSITIVTGCNPGGTAAPGDRATYRNIGQVTVPGATSSDPSHYCNTPNPGIKIKKLTNGADANDSNGSDVPQIMPGAPVTWTYIVTNTGDITFSLAQVQVADNQPGVTPVWVPSSDTGNDQLLSPGETWRYQATGIAQNLKTTSAGVNTELGCNPTRTTVPSDRLAYFNIGLVNVPGATASDPSLYCNPPVAGIDLQKTVYKGQNQGGFCPGGELVIDSQDSPVTYCFEITNTGETYLSNIKLIDNDLGITLNNMTLRSGTTPLAPGAKLVYFYETTLKQNLLNLATVTGHPTDNRGQTIPGLSDPTDQDTAEVQVLPTAIDLVYINLTSSQNGVTLSWAKLPTHDTAGYQLYRSTTSQRGSAVRITNELLTGRIENKGDAGTLVSYTFADANVQTGTTYYYWLVEVKVDGSISESGPVQVKPQSPAQNYQIFMPTVSR